jgi:hypothetical protein
MDRRKSGQELNLAGVDEGVATRFDACLSINKPVRSIKGLGQIEIDDEYERKACLVSSQEI